MTRTTQRHGSQLRQKQSESSDEQLQTKSANKRRLQSAGGVGFRGIAHRDANVYSYPSGVNTT